MRRVRAISAFCFRIWSTCFPAGDRSCRSAPSKARSLSGSRSRFASMQSFLTASVIALTWTSRTADLLLLLAHRREELLLAPGHLLLGSQCALVGVDRLGPVTGGECRGDRVEPVRDWLRHRPLPL